MVLLGCLVLFAFFCQGRTRAPLTSSAPVTQPRCSNVENPLRNDVAALGQALGLARLRSQGPPRQVTNCSNSEWHARGPASPPSLHFPRLLPYR